MQQLPFALLLDFLFLSSKNGLNQKYAKFENIWIVYLNVQIIFHSDSNYVLNVWKIVLTPFRAKLEISSMHDLSKIL